MHIEKKMTLRNLIYLSLSLAFGQGALAQENTLREVVEGSAVIGQEASPLQKGRGLVFVFEKGNPKEGVLVTISGKPYQSDSSGVIRLELPAGSYQLQPEGFEGGAEFQIVAAEETEVILNLLPPNQMNAESKNPEAFSAQKSIREEAGATVKLVAYAADSKKPINGATLLVSGYGDSISSNANGEFLLKLPAGNFGFTILHSNFETETKEMAVSPSGELNSSPVLYLKPAVSSLEEFVVLAPKIKGSVSALIEVRKNSSAVADVLGSEQMAKQGDSDAGSSLRRVTGLTLVGGKYVYVRGLGERYTTVTLNGSTLPSPEPARRVIPLDLFPTSVLESVLVQKSFSPNLPGEFGGGLIQLQTRSLPDQAFFKASLSTALEANVRRITYQGGSTDWMGIDDGTRALPEGIRSALKSGKKLNENNPPFFTDGFSAEELTQLGRSLKVRYNTNEGSGTSLPGLALSGGGKVSAGPLTIGALASGSHSSSFETGSKESYRYDAESAGRLTLFESTNAEYAEREVKSSGTLDIGVETAANHSLHGNLLLVRHSTDETQIKNSSRTGDSVASRRITELEWVERQLFTKQISGKHLLGFGGEHPLELQWRATESIARRDAPDTREYVYEERNGAPSLVRDNNGNRRQWSELNDQAREFGAELNQAFSLGSLGQGKLLAGATLQRRERIADVWRLHMRIRDSNLDLTTPPDSIFGEANIAPGKIEITNLTESADSMSGEQQNTSFFGGGEWSPIKSLTFATGMRRESGRQLVKTFYYFDKENPTSIGGLETKDWLPAHSLTWKPSEQIRARLAYSETVARPEFRELSTVPFIDDETGYETVGYDKLRGTVIRNYDHRWEFYPTPEESASIGFFYKEFQFPIEEVFEPSPNLRKTFRNVEAARNAGIELDGRIDLRRITRFLRRWSLLGNLSLIRSRVELGEEARGQQTSAERPLQGQSPWVANIQVQYERPAQGRTLGLLYNVVGPRITEVGTNLRPDIYEQPFHQVDFVASQKFGRQLSLGLRAKNLLDPRAKATQGPNIVRTQKKGRSLHVTLSAAF